MSISTQQTSPPQKDKIPPLKAGDRLTADEFWRRYEAMPEIEKAELIEGVVYMPSPVNNDNHGRPHYHLIGWMSHYSVLTPGVDGGDNSTVKLDVGNVPQPDVHLRLEEGLSGQSRNEDGYIIGGPELCAEIAATSAKLDLGDRLLAYQKNDVQEYIVWRVLDRAVDWFILRDGEFVANEPQDGVLQSKVFPGLWLDAEALIRGDMLRVIEILQKGMATQEYDDYVKDLNARANDK